MYNKTYNTYKKLIDDHGGRLVKIVALPLPPCPAHGVIYMPDGFTSKSFDAIPTFDSDHRQIEVLACKRTEFGPAILAYVRLSDLISFDELGHLFCLRIAICARVSYRILCEEGCFTMADDISLESVSFNGSSCHPGSHVVVPGAPYLSAVLQYKKSPKFNTNLSLNDQETITYMDPFDAEIEFNDVDFSQNLLIDALISRCIVAPNVSAYDAFKGLGVWAAPFLKDMRKNVLIKESCHEFIVSKTEVLC